MKGRVLMQMVLKTKKGRLKITCKKKKPTLCSIKNWECVSIVSYPGCWIGIRGLKAEGTGKAFKH